MEKGIILSFSKFTTINNGSDIQNFGKQEVKTLSFLLITTAAKNSDPRFLELKDFGMKDSSLLSCGLFAQCVYKL